VAGAAGIPATPAFITRPEKQRLGTPHESSMGGIRARNLFEHTALYNAVRYGVDVWYPPLDEQLIVASVGISSATADAAFSLSTTITNLGQYLPWPQRLRICLRNRAADTSGAPGITQANPTLAGSSSFSVRVTGKLAGKTQVEVVVVSLGSLVSVASTQRQHVDTVSFFDYITSIEHISKVGTWGGTTALQVSVGTANAALGEGAPTGTTSVGATPNAAGATSRIQLAPPFRLSDPNLLERAVYPDEDGASAQPGETNNARVWMDRTSVGNFSGGVLRLPGRAPIAFNRFGLGTVNVTTDVITINSHGLALGDVVRLESYVDGLPGNVSEGVNYYVAGDGTKLTANTFALKTTANDLDNNAGTFPIVDLTAVGTFADGESVRVLRPVRQWRRARLILEDGIKAEGV
jgi:hypothetical protein